MIKDQIEAIKLKLQGADHLTSETKAELNQLLADLEAEITLLSETHNEEARRIARSTHASAEELTRKGQKPEMIEAALDDLRSSVAGFETSHPKMTNIVGRIATTLSNMGI
jgi:F0F1-type ATP synthase membrane subunit b/b'